MEEVSTNVLLRALKIYAHPAVDAFAIVPAHKYRGWMDESPNRLAYRCLPLDIANQMVAALKALKYEVRLKGTIGKLD